MSNHRVKSKLLGWELLILILSLVAAAWWGSDQLRNLTVSNLFYGDDFYGDRISDGDKFDYIVVGAGTAGCAVAARLAMAGLHVLLVEAGGEPNIFSKIPKAAVTKIGSELDWSYETLTNNKSCLGARGAACRFPRGKCLGGSTCINRLLYTRGNRKDFDFDLPEWSWKEMEPYFMRFEGFKNAKDLPYHNTTGIMPIDYFNKTYIPWHSRLFEAFQSLNFSKNADVNGLSQIGVSQVPGYISDGERISTAKAYLNKNVKKTLTVAKNVFCTGVIIGDDNVTSGITVSKGANKTLRLYSRHEVILSAGTIGTPHLLMLSGIGPKDHLQKLSINVKADLPVGEDMSDHILPLTVIKVDHDANRFANIISIGRRVYEAVQWWTTRTGELASVGIDDITAFVNSECYDFNKKILNNSRPECEIPTLQYVLSYMDKGFITVISSIYDRIVLQSDEIKRQLWDANENSALIIAAPLVLRPHSRGWIRLASASPLVPPLIFPNYLDDDRDVEEAVRGLEIIKDIVNTPVFRKYNASILRLNLKGCKGDRKYYWKCYVRHMTFSGNHAVGTASLGRVLDNNLRVRGVKNLRVADASALPLLPRGNTAAAIIALGERVSDMVLQDIGMETYISKLKYK